MTSLRLRLASAFARLAKRRVAREPDPLKLREAFADHARRSFFHPPHAVYRRGQLGDVPVLWASAGAVTSDDVIFYIHGGGFVLGSPRTHCHMAASLAARMGCEAVLPQYRLAPEHPFPAGIEDVIAAYEGLLVTGRDPARISICGDSAGGCFVFLLLAHISKAGLPLPRAAVAISPVVNLAGTYPSMTQNADSDALLPVSRFHDLREVYLGDTPAESPEVSPVHARFDRCPPVLMHHCDGEILRDDTLEMQRHLLAAGHDVTVRSWPNNLHVFHLFIGQLPESAAALDDIAAFITSRPAPADS